MLTREQIEQTAQRLESAERNRQQMRSVPFDYPEVDVEDAFVLKSPLRGPGVRVTDVLAATAAASG